MHNLAAFPFCFDLEKNIQTRVKKQFNSKEKQFVRNHLWLPIYKEVCSITKPIGKIKYLCFPGLGCNFIKQLLGLGYILKDCTTVVAVEPNKFWHKTIYEYLAQTFAKSKYEVLEGNYEDLIEEQRLTKWFFQPPFGFDILELDFPVPLFSLSPDKRSRVLESIAKTLKLQAFFGRNFYMIASFKGENTLPANLGSVYGDSTKMLVEEILKRENSLLENKTLSDLISSPVSGTPLYQERCSLFAIPLAIIRRSEGICNVKLHQIPYTHISKSVGGKTRIMSYIFWCEPRTYTIDCAGDKLFNETKKNIEEAIEKIDKAYWVKLDK